MKSYWVFLLRNKFFTLIEILSLSTALGFLLIIGSFALRQFSITRETPSCKDIYFTGTQDVIGLSYGIAGPLSAEIPEIETLTRIMSFDLPVEAGDEKIQARVYATDKHFFQIFTNYRILAGSAEELDIADHILLSESFAKRIFPSEKQVVGKTLTLDGKALVVAGIVEDFRNTLFKETDIFLPAENPLNPYSRQDPFDHFAPMTIFKAVPHADRCLLQEKVDQVCARNYPFYGNFFLKSASITRLDEVFFSPKNVGTEMLHKGDRGKLRMLGAIVLVLLVSALLNYVNLNTALIGNRAKEIAIRRLLGESRTGVFLRQTGEAILFTALCFLLALALASAALPYVNSLLSSSMEAEIPFSLKSAALFLSSILVIGCVAGLAPSLVSRRYSPIGIVQGNFRRKNKMVFSKVFIGVQNLLTVFLISLSAVMEAQTGHVARRPVNADLENKFQLSAFVEGASKEKLEARLRALPCVERLGHSNGFPGFIPTGQRSHTRNGDEITYRLLSLDSTAFNMLRFNILHDFSAPTRNVAWFSERAFAMTGFDLQYHDISQTLSQRASGCEQVAGVLEDFLVDGSNTGEEGLAVVSVVPAEEMPSFPLFLLQTTGNREQAREMILTAYKQWCAEETGTYVEPFCMGYCQDILSELQEEGFHTMRLAELFMLAAIIVSSLGLSAMSCYFSRLRAKANAIKKIYGIPLQRLILQNLSDYLAVIGIALLAGIPLSIGAARLYLAPFTYRIEKYGWIFVAASAATLLLSLMAVWQQTMKSVRCDPAGTLKGE